jgi:hypothetical protein
MSKFIIFDKNSLFTFNFWLNFCYHLKIKIRLNIVFHFQTDEQTEKQNQTLKQYLRIYVNYQQNNWTRLLFVIEYVYNNNWHRIIKMSSFAILYRDDDISRWKDQIQENLKKMCQRHELESKKSRSSEINYIIVWKRRKVIKLNLMMKSTLFEFLTLKTRFYWTSETFIFLNRQKNLIINITNRLKSKNSLRSKFISCDYFTRFEYTMCFMFLCWNCTKNDSTM